MSAKIILKDSRRIRKVGKLGYWRGIISALWMVFSLLVVSSELHWDLLNVVLESKERHGGLSRPSLETRCFPGNVALEWVHSSPLPSTMAQWAAEQCAELEIWCWPFTLSLECGAVRVPACESTLHFEHVTFSVKLKFNINHV